MNLARLGNKYLADTEPWKLKNTDESRAGTIINIALQIVSHISVLSEPFLPFTSKKLCDMLKINLASWDDIYEISDGHQIDSPCLLFSKIEDHEIDDQLNKLNR